MALSARRADVAEVGKPTAYKRIARIDYDKCIGCNSATSLVKMEHTGDRADQPNGEARPGVCGQAIPKSRTECVDAILCSLVCPVDECITMFPV